MCEEIRPRRGHIGEDGLLLWCHRKGKKPRWVTQDVFDALMEKERGYAAALVASSSRNTNYKRGDVREDGKIFWQYRQSGKERWVTPTQYEILKARHRDSAKKRYHDPTHNEKIKGYMKGYAERTTESRRAYMREYYRKRRLSDSLYDIKYRVRTRFREAFRRMETTKSSKSEDLLGCNWITLKNHLESKFVDGMSWENRQKWHIDHIIPLASAKNEEEIVRLCHYLNLQPLYAADNIRKGARMPKEHSLAT